MNSVGKQNTFWLTLILGTSLLFGAFSLCGSMPTFAYGAPAESAQTGGSAQAQDANASTAFQDVEVSSEGSSARTSDVDFALSDFSRVEKGSNRPIEGTYQGYCYLMDAPADSLCLVDLSGVVVVYVPEALAKQNGLDLANEQTQASLKLLFSALDSYDAQGNSIVKNDAEWLFTSKQSFTTHGLTIGFSQEYKPGYFYTSVQTDTGADVMGEESPLATDANLRLAHVDYANLQASDAVAIAAAPSAFEQLGSFFQTLDWSPLLVTLKTTGTAIIFIFILGLLAAWWTLRLKPRTQSIMDAIFTIPMVLPPTVCGFLLLMFLGRNTPVGAWFDQIGFPLVFSWQATVIAAVVVAFPLMYRSARGAFESIDADMLDAARTLGWSEGRIFFRLMLPLAWSSVAAGTMLAFARALGEFGATLFLAGNYAGITRTIPIAIYFEWMGGNIEAAFFWTIVVIIISFAVIFAINLWSKRTTKYRRKEVEL